MFEIVLGVALGLLGGVAVGIQSPLAGIISEKMGGASSSLVVHVSGAIVSILLLLARGGERIQNWRSVPWYMFGVGSLGVVLYLTISYTIPRLGATPALALIVVGQMVTGFFLDTFGWFGLPVRPVEFTRLLAIGLLMAGAYLMLK